jgi:hypothetical protein
MFEGASMGTDELSGIAGLDERRRDVLAAKLGITTCYDLILAERRAVANAFGRKAQRPTLEEVAEWQDAARRKRAAAVPANGWEQVASFVVVFERRGRPSGEARRVVAEQTEVEPEAKPREWDGWDLTELSAWMLNRLIDDGASGAPPPPRAIEAAPADRARVRADRSRKISVERAVLRWRDGEVDLTTAPPDAAVELTAPCNVTLQMARDTGAATKAVLRLISDGDAAQERLGWRVDDHGRMEIELVDVPSGRYGARLAVWTPDGSAGPTVLALPPLLVRPSPPSPTSHVRRG